MAIERTLDELLIAVKNKKNFKIKKIRYFVVLLPEKSFGFGESAHSRPALPISRHLNRSFIIFTTQSTDTFLKHIYIVNFLV